MRRISVVMLIALTGCLLASLTSAQGRRDRRRDADDRAGVPNWEVDGEFKDDVFTFVRIRYDDGGGRWGRGWRGGWRTDYPDSDLNLSYRLQQLTSLRVDPDAKILDLTDGELLDYPFIYMLEPGRLYFSEAEVQGLRNYLQRGGFLMVDDFWGEDEWRNFEREILKVFPDRKIIDLPPEHPIFHCVYDLKEPPQIPSINAALYGRGQGITWERGWDTRDPHYRAILDDDGRMMVIICHNTDLGDGWEEEGVDPWYFREFAEKKAYPMGINILFYAMTH